MLIDFEDIEQKCRNARETEEFALLSDKINKAKKIFLLGNGGLHYVASNRSY